MSRLYIVYDGRAMYDVDSASVFTTANSLKEAREDAKSYGEGVIYSYAEDGTDEQFEEYVHV